MGRKIIKNPNQPSFDYQGRTPESVADDGFWGGISFIIIILLLIVFTIIEIY